MGASSGQAVDADGRSRGTLAGVYTAGIAGARLAVIEGAGHMVPMERPAEFTTVVPGALAS
jgi:pimeloyl-ACP methyl ester carboxylesterase